MSHVGRVVKIFDLKVVWVFLELKFFPDTQCCVSESGADERDM